MSESTGRLVGEAARAQVSDRRQPSILLDGGLVDSEDGNAYLEKF